MRVQLAYGYRGHAPDEIIEVDDRTGRRLLREGRARSVPSRPVPEKTEPLHRRGHTNGEEERTAPIESEQESEVE